MYWFGSSGSHAAALARCWLRMVVVENGSVAENRTVKHWRRTGSFVMAAIWVSRANLLALLLPRFYWLLFAICRLAGVVRSDSL